MVHASATTPKGGTAWLLHRAPDAQLSIAERQFSPIASSEALYMLLCNLSNLCWSVRHPNVAVKDFYSIQGVGV